MGLKYPKESLYKIWIKLVQWFQRRGCLKMLKDRQMLRTGDRQSQSHWYTISSPMSLQLRWAKNVGLKIVENLFDINFYICFGCSKEPSHWDDSFEYLNHMFWLKIWKVILNCILLFFFIMKPTIVLIIIILLLLISMGFHSTLWVVLLEISWFSAAVCKSNHFIIHVNCKVQSKALKSRWEEDRNTNVQAWSCEVSCVTCWQVFYWTWW